MRLLPTFAALLVAACNSNTSPGSDRESQLDAAPTPAPQMDAASALSGIAVEAVQPETITDADLAALGGLEGRCAIRLTGIAFPSFLYERGGTGTIKLNGKLITLPATDEERFAEAGLTVWLRPADGEGSAGLQEYEMVVMLPGAEDELGFRGYRQCIEEKGEAP